MHKIESKRLIYRVLTKDDVTDTYVSWLNDPQVNNYLEVKHIHNTIENCDEFVEKSNNDPAQNLFGIFLRENQKHIGNIKIGFVNKIHGGAQLSLFIGDTSCWGKGYATEAIQTISQWGFKNINLKKIEAGCYDVNIGSLRSFLKAGYQVEGYLRNSVVLDDKRIGSFWLGVLENEVTE